MDSRINTPQNKNYDDDDVIMLLPLLNALIRRWWLIVLAAIVFGIGTYAGTKLFVEPTYQASFTAYINNSTQNANAETVTTSDITASRNLTSTYAAVIISQPNIESAIKTAEFDYTYKEVAPSVSVSTVNDTEIICVTVTTTNPYISYKLASALQKVSPDYVANIVKGSSMMIVAPPNCPTGIYSPNYLKNTIIGMMLGGFLVAAIIVLLELLDKRIKDADELESRYGIVVIGTIHDLTATRKTGYGSYGISKGKEE